MTRKRQSLTELIRVWSIILLALGVFGGATFALLRVGTNWPVWLSAVASGVVAIGGFALFVWTHQTNGFDGPMISMDELKTKMSAMSAAEQSRYLAQFSEEDREILERELKKRES